MLVVCMYVCMYETEFYSNIHVSVNMVIYPAEGVTRGGGTFIGRWYRSHDPFFFFFFSGQSALPSLPIFHQFAAHVPHIFNFRKNLHLQSCFGPKFQFSRCKMSQFLLLRPLIFKKKKHSLDSTFGNPRGTYSSKKLSAPSRGVTLYESLTVSNLFYDRHI